MNSVITAALVHLNGIWNWVHEGYGMYGRCDVGVQEVGGGKLCFVRGVSHRSNPFSPRHLYTSNPRLTSTNDSVSALLRELGALLRMLLSPYRSPCTLQGNHGRGQDTNQHTFLLAGTRCRLHHHHPACKYLLNFGTSPSSCLQLEAFGFVHESVQA